MWMPETDSDARELSSARVGRRELSVRCVARSRGDRFDRARPIFLARAPGRLDVMGGIADYSGALVLEMPIAAATWVAAQASDEPEVVIESDASAALGGEAGCSLPARRCSSARAAHATRRRARC